MSVNLNYWLRKTPQPIAVLADDKRIEVPKNGRAWRDLTQTIKSLEPSKLTCLDGQGNVIRSIVLESESEETDAEPATPEQSDLQLFARLLAEGYQHGMQANQPIIDSAMAFVERQSVRLAKAEAEIDRLRQVIHKQHMQMAELTHQPPPPADDSIMGTLLAGALQGAAASATATPALTAVPKGAVKK